MASSVVVQHSIFVVPEMSGLGCSEPAERVGEMAASGNSRTAGVSCNSAGPAQPNSPRALIQVARMGCQLNCARVEGARVPRLLAGENEAILKVKAAPALLLDPPRDRASPAELEQTTGC
jgi:hypothetical protein